MNISINCDTVSELKELINGVDLYNNAPTFDTSDIDSYQRHFTSYEAIKTLISGSSDTAVWQYMLITDMITQTRDLTTEYGKDSKIVIIDLLNPSQWLKLPYNCTIVSDIEGAYTELDKVLKDSACPLIQVAITSGIDILFDNPERFYDILTNLINTPNVFLYLSSGSDNGELFPKKFIDLFPDRILFRTGSIQFSMDMVGDDSGLTLADGDFAFYSSNTDQKTTIAGLGESN